MLTQHLGPNVIFKDGCPRDQPVCGLIRETRQPAEQPRILQPRVLVSAEVVQRALYRQNDSSTSRPPHQCNGQYQWVTSRDEEASSTCGRSTVKHQSRQPKDLTNVTFSSVLRLPVRDYGPHRNRINRLQSCQGAAKVGASGRAIHGSLHPKDDRGSGQPGRPGFDVRPPAVNRGRRLPPKACSRSRAPVRGVSSRAT